MFHTVVPWPSGLCGPAQLKALPPQASISMPRCFWYQSRIFWGSADLMKMPPMPVTRFISRTP